MKPSRIEHELNYRILFDTMSEGFSLVDGIRNEAGELVDYTILEINPALQRMLGVGPEVAGTKWSLSRFGGPLWLDFCSAVLATGVPNGFEIQNPITNQWYEIRVTRVAKDRLAQFSFDITDRKLALANQAALFDELNHRVKNNLTVVSSLLHLQARGATKRVREHLMKAADRVETISDLHGALYRGDRKSDVDFSAYLTHLCERLTATLVADNRIAIAVHAEPLAVPLDHAVPLGLVVNELVTNATKYAYPAPACGVIDVRFVSDNDGILLSVSDTGVGLGAGHDGKSRGMGMKLVNAFVRQVAGTLSVRQQQGVAFEIRLPSSVTP